jgi:hypothetical protein
MRKSAAADALDRVLRQAATDKNSLIRGWGKAMLRGDGTPKPRPRRRRSTVVSNKGVCDGEG